MASIYFETDAGFNVMISDENISGTAWNPPYVSLSIETPSGASVRLTDRDSPRGAIFINDKEVTGNTFYVHTNGTVSAYPIRASSLKRIR
jgi:hypothetical protein